MVFRSLFFSAFLVVAAFGQAAKTELDLNALDFSRYPTVDLYVTATTDGDPVDTDVLRNALRFLRQDDFRNIPVEELESVYDLKMKGEAEMYIALVFDNSASMKGRNKTLEDAAMKFIDGILPGDYVGIFDFGDGSLTQTAPEFDGELYARQRIGFTSSKLFLKRQALTPNFSARTYMYDAMLYALSRLNASTVLGQKLLIFFSDGMNVGSESDMDDVRKWALEYDIPIYALDLSASPNPQLEELAEVTLGEYFFIENVEDLEPMYEALLKMLKSQYRVSYQTPEPVINRNNTFVEVRLEDPLAARADETFEIDGEKIGFFNLTYLKDQGAERVDHYLNYLMGFPNSQFRDRVELNLADYWFDKGFYAKPLAIYNRILRDPTNSAYYAALAQKAELLLRAEEYAAARAAYEKLIFGGSDLKPKAMLDLAGMYNAEGNYTSALNTYSQLSSEYEGTEWAAEGLYQSATVNINMGNLDDASKDLDQLIEQYGESESALYGMFELAKIKAERGDHEGARELFEHVSQSSRVDDALRWDAAILAGESAEAEGDYAAAADYYKTALDAAAGPATLERARLGYIRASVAAGDLRAARLAYDEAPDDAREEILADDAFEYSDAGTPAAALLNGATIQPRNASGGANTITIVDSPEMREKFAVLGPIYLIDVAGSEFDEAGADSEAPSAAYVSIPVRKSWDDEDKLPRGEAGLYYYNANQIELVTDEVDLDSYGFDFATKRSGLYAVLSKRPVVVTLYDIYFDFGKASIRKESERNLYEMVDDLKRSPLTQVEIAGHTDSIGSDGANQKLSLRRADAIKDFFVENGVDPERMITRGYGSQFPVAPNDTEENRQLNRRTEFTILGGETHTASKVERTERFAIVVESFIIAKKAYELKKYFEKRGYAAAVVTGAIEGGRYDVLVGIYDNEKEANDEAEKFKREYRHYDPTVVEL
jgi:outer membrane protein OmpA-like peptidoglycan-associated protein/thioredoxin-like negative regulator of GroEL